jgi:hypothetical protein
MSPRFVPDLRNLGGRKAIADMMTRHHEQLRAVKPTLELANLAPLRIRTHKQHDFEPPRSFSASHRGLDNSLPATYGLWERLSENRARKNKRDLREHQSNIKHMNRRIRAIGSLVERRKNPYDPLANPSLLFQQPAHSFITSAETRIRAKLLSPPRVSSVYEAKRKPVTVPSTSEDFPITPLIAPQDPAPLQTLETQLLAIITHYRVYQDQELAALFARTRLLNRELAPALLDKAIARVQQRLDS